MREVNREWLRYWEASHGVIHQYVGGYIFMMSIWSVAPATDLQCDFSALISPEAFDRLCLPFHVRVDLVIAAHTSRR